MNRCDGRSVAMLVDVNDRLLLLTRARPPIGVAPAAGHVDNHGGPQAAAAAEMREELGLQVMTLTPLACGWRANRCRRPGNLGGHHWWLYRAQVTGQLHPSPAETRVARWYSRQMLQRLANRTAAYVTGQVSDRAWRRRPGLEPLWCAWFAELGLVTLPAQQFAAAEHYAITWTKPNNANRKGR